MRVFGTRKWPITGRSNLYLEWPVGLRFRLRASLRFRAGLRFRVGLRFREGLRFRAGLRFRVGLRFREGLRFRAGLRFRSRPSFSKLVFGPGGVLPKILGRGVRPASQTLTLFMTKICDFPYPIYDLTKNLIPYL